MDRRRIWILSEIYYPIKTSTGYYVTEIAEHLAQKGLDVHVICTRSSYTKGETCTLKRTELHNGVHIHRVYSPNLDKNNLLKRVIRLSVASINLFFKALFSVKKGDQLFAVTNPAFLMLAMPLLSGLKRVSYVLLVHDIFPENLVAIKKISSSSYLYKCLRGLFNRAYSGASTCISIGRDMSVVLADKIKDKNKISLIPIWSENAAVFPVKKDLSETAVNLNIQQRFIFQFAGNLGQAQGIDNLLEAISMVDCPNIHFLFIGAGAKEKEIKSYIQTHPDKNITLLGFQSRDKQNDFLNACDVGVVTLADGMFGLGVPSKSYNIMAAGKPILYVGEEKSELALCIREYGIGWVVTPNNPMALSEAIDHIYKHREQLEEMKKKARKIAEDVYAKELVLKKYSDLFMKK